MTTMADALGNRMAGYIPLQRFFRENRKVFEFMANHLNSPFAKSLIRELDKKYPDFDEAYHRAVCALQDALKIVGCNEFALRLTKHTVGPATSEGFDLLEEGVHIFTMRQNRA